MNAPTCPTHEDALIEYAGAWVCERCEAAVTRERMAAAACVAVREAIRDFATVKGALPTVAQVGAMVGDLGLVQEAGWIATTCLEDVARELRLPRGGQR
jgi:hypothetical protein